MTRSLLSDGSLCPKRSWADCAALFKIFTGFWLSEQKFNQL